MRTAKTAAGSISALFISFCRFPQETALDNLLICPDHYCSTLLPSQVYWISFPRDGRRLAEDSGSCSPNTPERLNDWGQGVGVGEAALLHHLNSAPFTRARSPLRLPLRWIQIQVNGSGQEAPDRRGRSCC